jgi:DNA invertase Pin-like site-specific DNA recombinase
MDSERLPHELGLDEEEIQGLLQAGLVRLRPQKSRPKERIDYAALQQTYLRTLAEGGFSTQTELARNLGVSRVWVSRVLKGIKRKTG